MDPGLNQLLKWGIENSEASCTDPTSTTDTKAERPDWPAGRPLNPEALKALMGGPSDADLMKESMAAIQSPDVSVENKLVAFDNFEQLIETIDNANNMESLGLWTPLIRQLSNQEPDMRRMAAWCLGTAVQNNVKAQERARTTHPMSHSMKLTNWDTVTGSRRNIRISTLSNRRHE